MADNTTLSTGSGGDVIATDDLATLNGGASGTVKVQRVKVGYGADGDFNDVSAANPLPIVGRQGANTPLNVTTSSSTTGSISCTGYNVATVVISGTHAGINLTFEISLDGGTTYVPINGAQLDAPVATVGGATGVITSNASRGWDIAVGAASHIRVRSTAYTSGTGAVGVALQTLPYEPLPVATLGAGLNTNMIGGVNTSQVNGVAPLMGNGVTGTGSQRVTVASDNTAFNVINTPAAPTTAFTNNAATTNATSAKASAGTLYALVVNNNSAELRNFKLYNKASAPTVGTDVPVLHYQVAAGATLAVSLAPVGARHSLGIAWALLGAAGTVDASTTACTDAATTKVALTYI